MEQKTFPSKKFMFILIPLLGIAVNLFGAWCARFWTIPLYLDSAATIAVTHFCGLVPGLFVSFFTNLIMTLFFGTPIVFSTCHMMTAFGAWVIFKLADKDKRPNIDLFLLSGLLSVLTNGIIGSVYSYVMYNGEVESSMKRFADYIQVISGSLFVSSFASGIITNLADKILSAILSYLFALGIFRFQDNNKPVFKRQSKRDREAIPDSSEKIHIKPAHKKSVIPFIFMILSLAILMLCVFMQQKFRDITNWESELASSNFVMILTSVILFAASFLIVYAKMISEQKAKEMEEHRHELSQNLHDGVLQNLVALNASLETQLLKKEDDGQINSQIHFIRNSINELRLLCGILRLDDDVPFEESIQHSLDAFRQTYGLSIKLGLACDTSIFTSVQKEHLLRILYESLSNSANHSDAKNILVTIADDGSGKYYFTIRDDGTKQTQTNSDSKNITHGLGLKSIKARAEKLGGHAEFTQDEDGWTVRVVF